MTSTTALEGMYHLYQHTHWYSDRGSLLVQRQYPYGQDDTYFRIHFQTLFARPHYFSFIFITQSNNMEIGGPYQVLFRDGQSLTNLGEDSRITSHPTFARAIATATGISVGSIQEVASLLLPDQVLHQLGPEQAYRIMDVEEPSMMTECLCLECQLPQDHADLISLQLLYRNLTGRHSEIPVDSSRRLFIDRNTYHLKRIQIISIYQTYKKTTTIRYEPSFLEPESHSAK